MGMILCQFQNQSIWGFVANYLCLVLLGYLGGFLTSKVLTGSPQKLILESKLSPAQATLDITRQDPLTWPVNNTCSDLAIYEFSFRVTQAQSEQQAKFQLKVVTSHLLERKPPTIMGLILQLTLWLRPFSLKVPLWWEDHPCNIRKFGWVPYEQCLRITVPLEMVTGMEPNGSDDQGFTGLCLIGSVILVHGLPTGMDREDEHQDSLDSGSYT